MWLHGNNLQLLLFQQVIGPSVLGGKRQEVEPKELVLSQTIHLLVAISVHLEPKQSPLAAAEMSVKAPGKQNQGGGGGVSHGLQFSWGH